MKAIEVKLEVGHKSYIKDKPDAYGYTHDWNVFVRAGDNQSIEKFIRKIVFNLHETFQNPKRSKKFEDLFLVCFSSSF